MPLFCITFTDVSLLEIIKINNLPVVIFYMFRFMLNCWSVPVCSPHRDVKHSGLLVKKNHLDAGCISRISCISSRRLLSCLHTPWLVVVFLLCEEYSLFACLCVILRDHLIVILCRRQFTASTVQPSLTTHSSLCTPHSPPTYYSTL